MSILITSVCCMVVFSNLLFNPLISLERFFAQPLYNLKAYFSKSDRIPSFTKPASQYTIVLIGDSMTQALGAGEYLKEDLRKYYPKKEIHVLNYGIGSTNILALPDRLEKGAVRGSESLFPVLSKDFNLILIESFGHNPLQLPISEGLIKQNEILDKAINMIRSVKPEAVILFMATVAPSRQRYAEGIVNLSPDERKKWAEERIAYIKNHIKYAQDHKIPLINVYEKSLDKNGEVNPDYINDSDFIHPSNTGNEFISKEISNFIFNNRIFPL